MIRPTLYKLALTKVRLLLPTEYWEIEALSFLMVTFQGDD